MGEVLSAGMSAREAEVLDAVAAHLSNAQIAGRLHISVRTVESHVRSLLRKFGAADRRELAALAPAATSHVAAVGLPAQLIPDVAPRGLYPALRISRAIRSSTPRTYSCASCRFS